MIKGVAIVMGVALAVFIGALIGSEVEDKRCEDSVRRQIKYLDSDRSLDVRTVQQMLCRE